MGPTWVLLAPGGPHVGPMILAIWGVTHILQGYFTSIVQSYCPNTHEASYRIWVNTLGKCRNTGATRAYIHWWHLPRLLHGPDCFSLNLLHLYRCRQLRVLWHLINLVKCIFKDFFYFGRKSICFIVCFLRAQLSIDSCDNVVPSDHTFT